MNIKKSQCSENSVKYWILFGIPVVFIIGGFTHFIYELSGENLLVGIISPVNESVWEHLKMSFWGLLIWWLVGYFLLSGNRCISAAKWFSACSTALYVALFFIMTVYYLYTGALGKDCLIADILLLLVGIVAAQISGYIVYMCPGFHRNRLLCSILLIALLTAAFIIFTFVPPHIPLFIDKATGRYGIF